MIFYTLSSGLGSSFQYVTRSNFANLKIYIMIFLFPGLLGDGYNEDSGQLYHAILAARIGMLSQELEAALVQVRNGYSSEVMMATPSDYVIVCFYICL